jgi:hypothetical protein
LSCGLRITWSRQTIKANSQLLAEQSEYARSKVELSQCKISSTFIDPAHASTKRGLGSYLMFLPRRSDEIFLHAAPCSHTVTDIFRHARKARSGGRFGMPTV